MSAEFRASAAAGSCKPRRRRRGGRNGARMPAVLRAQGAPRQARRAASGHRRAVLFGPAGPARRARSAIEEINAAGGIKALGGAKIEAVLGDAQSTPEGGNAEVEKMNSAGVAAIVGGYASGICLAATQAAARYDLPYMVDVGVADAIVTRGLKNTFRFGPGFGVIAKTALDNLVTINDAGRQAGQDGDDRARGLAVRLGPRQAAQRATAASAASRCSRPSRTRRRRATSTTSCSRSRRRTRTSSSRRTTTTNTCCSRAPCSSSSVRPKGIYSVLGGAASSYKFVKEFPEAAQYIMDCNHWFDPRNPKALALKKKVEAQGRVLHLRGLHELQLRAAARRRAGARRRAPTAPRSPRRWRARPSPGHVMPYGPTKFVNGQNQGAAPVNTQVLDNDIKVILPATFAIAKPVFPMPPA